VTVAKSSAEQFRDMAIQIEILRERDAARVRELKDLSDDSSDLETELTKERDARQRLELEVASLKQQLQDHVKHTELSDTRRWSLILALLGAVLSLASGLIVALARK
jgi:hypothetical protein